MKLRNLFITLGLSLTVGVGVLVGVEAQQREEPKVAEAAKSHDSDYYLIGTGHWNFDNEDYHLWKDSSSTDLGYVLNISLTKGDIFRFAKNDGNWGKDCGGEQIAGGSASVFFSDNDDADNNCYCRETGTYNFYLNSSKSIYVEFASEGTYSYVLTNNSTYTANHFWGGAGSTWGTDINVSGQAYDIKFTYSDTDNFGLYRIDDRLIKSQTGFLLKTAGTSSVQQTGNISHTLEHTEEAYIGNWVNSSWTNTTHANTSNEYKAIAFLYDLVGHRNAVSYGGTNFAYSICATDKATATTLVNTYDSFNADTKSLLNNAYCKTYDVSGTLSEYTKSYQSVSDMVNALRIIANRNSGIGSNSLFNLSSESGVGTATIIVVIAAMSILTVAAYSFFKKGKSANKQ